MHLKQLLEGGVEAHRNVTTYRRQLVHIYDANGSNATELEVDGVLKLSEKYVAIVKGQTVQYWFEHVGAGDTGTMVLYKKGEVQSGGLEVLANILFEL